MRTLLHQPAGRVVASLQRFFARSQVASSGGGRPQHMFSTGRPACSGGGVPELFIRQSVAQTRRSSSAAIRSCVGRRGVAAQQAQREGEIGLYSDAALYDSVFSARQFETEADFLVEAFQAQCGRQPKSFLELGCGPGRHAVLLAGRGLRGHAVDNSPAMLEHVRAAAAAAGVTLEATSADIRRDSPAVDSPVDLAFLLCGTVSHLASNADALACFAATARSLNPGGLFFVEMVHPVDIFNGYVEVGESWEVEDPARGKLLVHYGADDGSDTFDAITQTLARTVTVTATKDGVQKALCRDTVRQRFFTFQEVNLLARASGLEVVAQYGGLTVPFKSTDDEDSYALVVVLQKQ